MPARAPRSDQVNRSPRAHREPPPRRDRVHWHQVWRDADCTPAVPWLARPAPLAVRLTVLLATVGGLRIRVPGLDSLPLRVHISSDLERRPVSVLQALRISRFGCIALVVRRRVREESILML